MVELIVSNKEWIFSGLGIAIISAILAIIKMGRHKGEKDTPNISGDKNIIGDGNIVQITNYAPEKQPSNLKIVDISFNVDNGLIVDIKLRNVGDQVAFIKEISFDILDYYNMVNPQITHYKLVESSNTYDVILGDKKQQLFKVSQSLGVNEVDRFQMKIASSMAETSMATIFYLSFSIIYDEDNKAVKSKKYLLPVPSTSEWAACYVSHTSKAIAKKNYLELKKMSNYDAIKSEHFLSILKSYEENKSDFLN